MKGIGKGRVGLEEAAAFFPLSGSTRAGNEVIMLLMGRDKQADQRVSTIEELEARKGAEPGQAGEMVA